MAEAEQGASEHCRCCDENAVAKLLYTYAERIDAGDFEGLADLFSDAVITFEESPERVVHGRDEAYQMYDGFTRRFPDNGTPHTRHAMTTSLWMWPTTVWRRRPVPRSPC